jgi:release factor glutamine methyltransferase
MNVAQLLQEAQHRLRQSGLEDPALESEFLLAELMGLSRPDIQWRRQQTVSPEIRDRFERGLTERMHRKPLAYIVGRQPFLKMQLKVTPAVLIPRPETELLAEKILEDLDRWEERARVVDIGTGSGNLAIALAQHPNVSDVIGLDRSIPALEVARENARLQGVESRCRWIESDLLEACPPTTDLRTLYVANLPYIRREDLEKLAPEVKWEPRLALDGGKNGLDLILRFIDQAEARLRANDVLWLEIGYDQAPDVEKRLFRSELWSAIRIEKDLAGWPRMVRAWRGD